MSFVTVNGAGLYYTERGSGPTVVFSHGLFWSSQMFAAQFAALSETHRCIAFDHRGQGQSELTKSGYDMDSLTLDAASLLEELKAGPCHWVGLSMGGFVGMRLAARRPELIRSLSLLNTASDAEPEENRGKFKVMGALARVLGMQLFAGTAMKQLFGKSFLNDPARKAQRKELRNRLVANRRAGAVRSLNAVVNRKPIVNDELHSIRAPTLVIAGEEDVSIVPARAQRTAAAIPGAAFELIPRAGHTSTLEEPELLTQALRTFISKVESR
jgi:3-oxoadipate enol-lactonase